MNRIKRKCSQWMETWSHSRFVRKQCLSAEDRIPTHLTGAEKRRLYEFGRDVQGTFVEIGSYLGASASFLAAGIHHQVPARKSILHCIDTWHNETMLEGERDTFPEFQKYTSKYREIIVPHRGTSHDVAQRFSERIDLLFIDGDHSYDAVKLDWDSWYPHLHESSWVLFHDVQWAEGVQIVVQRDVLPIATYSGSLPNLFWARIAKSER